MSVFRCLNSDPRLRHPGPKRLAITIAGPLLRPLHAAIRRSRWAQLLGPKNDPAQAKAL